MEEPFEDDDPVFGTPINQSESDTMHNLTRKRKSKDGPIQGNRKSPVWDHYNWIADEQHQLFAKCKYCDTKYKGDSRLGTTTAKRHTGGCDKYKEYLVNNPEKLSDYDQKMYCRLFAEAIMLHSYPLNIVEHDGLRKLHKYLNSNVRTISRNTILKYCCIEHEKLKALLCESLAGLTSRVCFTCDCWSACNTRGYLTLTAHYVDNFWQLKSKILNFRYFPPPHNGADIYDFVWGLLKEWGLEGKVFTMTVDNASPMDVMVTLLKSDLDSSSHLPCDGKFFHVRCSAHILNLIVQAGLKVVHGCVIKLRETAKYIENSDSRLTKFDQCVKDVGSKFVGRLCLDMPVRWNSTYLMLKRAIEAKTALQLFATRDKGFKFALSLEEWEISEFVLRFLQPFYNMTTLFSGSEYPTANLYFGNIVAIESLLVEAHKHRILSIQHMAQQMMTKFEKYWSKYSIILSIAAVLDPRYKLKSIKRLYGHLYSVGVDEKVKRVYDAFVELYSFYANSTSPSTNSASSRCLPTPSSSSKPISVYDILENLDDENIGDGNQDSAINSYLHTPVIPQNKNVEFDILSYWKAESTAYPVLSRMARDVLAIPITSVASESCFSLAGRVISKYRSRLLPKNAEVLVTTQNWLFGYVEEDDLFDDDDDMTHDVDYDSLPN